MLRGNTDLAERDPQAINDALQAFETLVNQYPDSRYARDSKTRIRYLYDALATREIAIARYYFSRQAYVATVNRCKFVLENYDNAASVEDALGIMMHSYRLMEFPKLADDTQRILAKNYPSSAYLALKTDRNPNLFSRLFSSN